MSKQIFTVPAEIRNDVGKGASRRLRHAGKVPAIVYGGDREPTNLALDHAFLLHAAKREAFHSSILELKVDDGRSQRVVLRDMQRHPFKLRITHADFLRVSDDHEIRLNVPIHFVNEEKSPAGHMAGVVISHQVTEVEISALPKDLPEYLEVDLAELDAGDAVMLSQIQLPEGVTIPALQVSEDNDVSIVSALFIRETQGTGVLAAEADAALAEAEEGDLDEADEEDAELEAAEGEEGEEGEEGKDGEAGERTGRKEGDEASGKED